MSSDPITAVPGRAPDADPRWVLQPGSVLLPSGEFAQELDVVVVSGVIDSVVPRGSVRDEGARIVRAPSSTLIAGLIDTHVHLTFSADHDLVENIIRDSTELQLARAAGNAQNAIARGVTTVVDCGGKTDVLIALRDALTRGVIRGPRVLVAGAPLTSTLGHCHWLGGVADTADDLLRVAREQAGRGVDVIKLMLTGGNTTPGTDPTRLQYPVAAVEALAVECERLGKPLIVHAHSSEAVALAARVGARVIVHATCSDPDGQVAPDSAVLAAVAASGCYVDPTIIVGLASAEQSESVPTERRQQQREAMLPVFRTMRELGTPLLAGTDAGVPGVSHGSVARSVIALHRDVGMSVHEAVRSATSTAAQAFGLGESLGEIRAGAVADLLLVEGQVGADIEALDRPAAVWKSGRLVVTSGALTYV